MSELKKGRRIVGAERDSLTDEVRGKYEAGASIRELAEQTGRSYGFIHRLLTESDTTLRGRGGSAKKQRS